MNQSIRGASALAILVLAAGCGAESDVREASASFAAEAVPASALAPRVVTVTAGDFFFRAPSTVTSGMTTIRLENQGPDLHHVQLIRLEGGRSMKDLMDAVTAGGPVPAWAVEVGGPNTPAPGARSEATLDLAPGDYALVCVIPAPDGVPHFMKGMAVPMTVVPAPEAGAPAPAADVTMTLRDYSFDFEAIPAGRRTIRVENQAEQAHEVLLVRLAPGKTAQDLMGWIEKPAGPPPGEPIGGTTAMARGEVNFVTADFTPGEYALLCLVPDAGDGRPHVAHGMARQITVR